MELCFLNFCGSPEAYQTGSNEEISFCTHPWFYAIYKLFSYVFIAR